MKRLARFELFAYILFTLGVLGDQISTRFCLTNPQFYETNPISASLMKTGLWLPIDLLGLISGIGICYLLIRKRDQYELRIEIILAFPIVMGIIRLGACIWNFHLLFV